MQLPAAIVQVGVAGQGAQAGGAEFLDPLLTFGTLLGAGGQALSLCIGRKKIPLPRVGAGGTAIRDRMQALIDPALVGLR